MAQDTERLPRTTGDTRDGSNTTYRVSPEKTLLPETPIGALERPGLVDRCDPAQRRLTLLVSAGGFGKTTLLADCCRRAEERGDLVIWLSVDEQDDARRLVAHLTYAADVPWEMAEPDGEAIRSTEMLDLDSLLAGIRSDSRRCILAIDELDRIPDDSARIIDYLIWRGPANLHLALACRQLPRLIDVATPIAQGRAISLGPEELRFTYPEFRAFFGSELTSERLGALWQESQGWPIAACLQRNFNQTNATEASQVGDNWVASRLMRGMATSDRKFLLEAACFEWADEDLFDEVLGVGSTQRLRELAILRGLLQRIDSGTRFRLHALIRRYAESELAGEDRDLRRRMAVAFAARGRTVDAVRQALRANDAGLAAEIVEDGGAIRLVCAFGIRGLQDAVGLLPEDIVRKSPRLRLAWLAAQAIGGKAFDPVAAGGILAVATGDGNDDDLRTDSLMLRGLMLMCGCVPAGSDAVRSVMVEGELAIAQTGFDPVVSAAISYGQAANHYQLGHLDAALAAIRRARGFSLETPSLALAAWILEGAILFAAGDVASSEAALTEALNTAQRQFPGHESPQLIGDAFAAEAAIEANRTTVARRRVPPLDRLARVGAWLDVYAASVDVRVELAHRQNAPAHASAILREAWEFARARGLSTFCRWLAAVRVSALIRAGRQDEAKELWRETGLPSDLEQLVDMAQQSWREMEAICCARVRLLLAGEDYAGALALGDAFAARARGSSVVRLQSWATAQAMCAAWRGGERRRAREYLVENLQLFRRTGFSRALLADPGTAAAVLEELDTDDEYLIAAKRAVLELIGISGSHAEVVFTNREIEILARLSDHRDKEIARALGLTDNGIRYHVRKVFAKLGAANRQEAVRKAKRLGVLTAVSGASDPSPSSRSAASMQ